MEKFGDNGNKNKKRNAIDYKITRFRPNIAILTTQDHRILLASTAFTICLVLILLSISNPFAFAFAAQPYTTHIEDPNAAIVAAVHDRPVSDAENAAKKSELESASANLASNSSKVQENAYSKISAAQQAVIAAQQAAQQKAEEEAEAAATKAQQAQRSEASPNISWDGSVLTKSSGVNYGPSGKETYYNLNMSGVVSIANSCGISGEYWVRDDGVKMYGNYVIVAADLNLRPRGSLVPTSLGTGIVLDTGTFTESNPTQLDIAVTW